MELEDYIENYDFIDTVKQYIDRSPRTIAILRKQDYLSFSGTYKKTELLLSIYCCKLLMILSRDWNKTKDYNQDKKFSKYCDLALSLYLNFFISSWKLACDMNMCDDDMMKLLKEERNPDNFYEKLKLQSKMKL